MQVLPVFRFRQVIKVSLGNFFEQRNTIACKAYQQIGLPYPDYAYGPFSAQGKRIYDLKIQVGPSRLQAALSKPDQQDRRNHYQAQKAKDFEKFRGKRI